MIDQKLIPLINQFLTKPAHALLARGITPNHITITGFAFGLIALPLIATQHYFAALIFIVFNRLMDGLDGVLARLSTPSDQGAFLDITLDFIFYASIPLGFAMASPTNALPAAFLLASFIGTGTSFLAFSLLAERRNLKSIEYPNKGIYYLGGLTEGFETILFFVLTCLFPQHFPIMALIFGAACWLTAFLRITYGYKSFQDKKDRT